MRSLDVAVKSRKTIPRGFGIHTSQVCTGSSKDGQATELRRPPPPAPSLLILWNQPWWRMALHLDGGPSPGHSWNSLSLQTYVHSESSGAIDHLSRSPQPSLAWKLAIGRGSFSPADTWSPGLIDAASPATQWCWEAPRSTAGGGRGRRKTDRSSQPSP